MCRPVGLARGSDTRRYLVVPTHGGTRAVVFLGGGGHSVAAPLALRLAG